MSFEEKLNVVLARNDELEALLGANPDGETFVKLSKELAGLKDVVEAIKAYKKAFQDVEDTQALLDDPDLDAEMRALAHEELQAAKDRLPELEKQLKILLLPKNAVDEKNAILEVRAGTGGEEAALFAAELFRMYEHYAAEQGWKFETLAVNDTGLGGYKEASAAVTGKSVFEKLKFESGVHRVQRVPETESAGRVHTSAATVAVLPEAEEVDLKIDEKDLKIDVYRASGAGGQHVNKTESAVRITHIPTGVVVSCQTQRSQFQNKDVAWSMLRARLYEIELKKKEEKIQSQEDAKADIGWGHQIRSYVLQPCQMVKDLRTEVETSDTKGVLDGDIDLFLEASLAARIQGNEDAS